LNFFWKHPDKAPECPNQGLDLQLKLGLQDAGPVPEVVGVVEEKWLGLQQ
jgi:hypothetical protein